MKRIFLASAALLITACGQTETPQSVAPEGDVVEIATPAVVAHDFFDGAWSDDEAEPILDKTMRSIHRHERPKRRSKLRRITRH